MNRVLVTLGTDGSTNWVRMPDGRKINLGVCSPLRFVVELASSGPAARRALNDFNAGVETMLSVDIERMGEVLRQPRRRWGAVPFIDSPEQRKGGSAPTEAGTTDLRGVTLMSDFAAIDQAVLEAGKALQGWSRAAGTPGKTASDTDAEKKAFYAALQGLFDAVKTAKKGEVPPQFQKGKDKDEPEKEDDKGGDKPKKGEVPPQFQKKDDKGKDEPKKDDKEDDKGGKPEKGKIPPQFLSKKAEETVVLSYDVFKANADRAQDTLKKLAAVHDRIESLKGKKGFDSVRATGDVLQVTSKVASILQDVDLTQSWVAGDLQKLAARADHLHTLFFPAKSE